MPWPASPAPQPDDSVLLVDFDTVKLFVGWKSTDTANDALLAQAINSVCSLIADYTDRQFVKETAASTRRFMLTRDDIEEASVMIDDLAELTSVDVVLRDGTLVQSIDVGLIDKIKAHAWRSGWPIEELQFVAGVVPGIGILDTLGITFPSVPRTRPGYAVDVTGKWGWPSIPDQAVYWALQTIADWSTKDISRFAASFRLDTGRVEIPKVLPDVAKAGLQLLRRVSV